MCIGRTVCVTFVVLRNGLYYGPTPKDEKERRHLEEIIERLWKQGIKNFSPEYMSSDIFISDDNLEPRAASYASLVQRSYGIGVPSPEYVERSATYIQPTKSDFDKSKLQFEKTRAGDNQLPIEGDQVNIVVRSFFLINCSEGPWDGQLTRRMGRIE